MRYLYERKLRGNNEPGSWVSAIRCESRMANGYYITFQDIHVLLKTIKDACIEINILLHVFFRTQQYC